MWSISFQLLTSIAILLQLLLRSIPTGASLIYHNEASNISPLSELGWTVPLRGGAKCFTNQTFCINELSAPMRQLPELLAIARGALTYECENNNQYQSPSLTFQSAELYDANSIFTRTSDEDEFHALIHHLYEFNYPGTYNSSMACIGSLYGTNDSIKINLPGWKFPRLFLEEQVNPPEDEDMNANWERYASHDSKWSVYRVEVSGGAAPLDCTEIATPIDIPFAAEYWFYHA